MPWLQLPTAHLYGKKGGKPLYITADIPIVVTLVPNFVMVPVFVQEDSEQVCLLSMNALSFLEIEVRDSNGIQPITQHECPFLPRN